jgi:tRNA-2-methylthio-N6-dimethylallyladenosine synthase
MQPPLDPAEAGRPADEHLLHPREGPGEGVLAAGRVARVQAGRPEVVIGVGGCVASQEGEAHHWARALRRPGVRAADPAPPARDDRRSCAATGPPAGGHELPRDREVRPPAGAARRGAERLRLRSWKAAASTAVSAWCPTRAATRSAGRSRVLREVARSRRRACARSRCWARTSTPTAARCPTARKADLATLIHFGWRDRRHRAHPLHHLPSAEFRRQLIEAYAELPQARQPPAPAGAERLGPHPRADARGYTALEFKQKIAGCAPCGRASAVSSDFIVGFPGETERDFAATLELIATWASTSPSASSTAAGPARRPRLPDDVPDDGQAPPAAKSCRRCSTAGAGHQRGHGRQPAARAGGAALAEATRASSPGAPRTTAG